MAYKFAAQLYTLREELKEGIIPLFKVLKEMGWEGVQISALPENYDQQEVAFALKENNLQAAGMHISLDRLTNDLDGVIKEAELYETKDIILPSIPKELHHAEGFKEVKRRLNHIAKEAPEQRISYHNHAFEFDIEINGQDGLHYLLNPANDNHILAEVDVYWVKKAGKDPLEYLTPYANRMPIIHLKDMTNDARQTFAEVGTGVIDFIPILQWGKANGIEWYAVEQDICERPPLESLEISLRNLQEFARKIN
ncbi:sugar phosphate isomerase/epimerase family protein [Metabacillus halosaccharovorans]|uniref:Sugar phosphate isomerase/epimerase n=1 Tax=Metabacillus halosaccharovorans TaxID=930124 RepID=A0ABT3DNC1_9BACI|nr:sugar phosphate isomerase/epimerase [Metabacillus halosaccharovorans]MCV9888565.1 sugar phosphate isomerase/epimerase [Metabacillus halosaccharovorans]